MAGDIDGEQAAEESQGSEELGGEQAAETLQVSGSGVSGAGVDWEKSIAERDERIATLEQQVADAAKNAEAAEALRNEIAELKAQGESDRIDFKLQLAGVRNVKAARAVLDDHGGDVDALKEAEPWLFADAVASGSGAATPRGGKTGLPNAGAATDSGKTLRRWRRIAGLDDADTNE